MKLHIKHEAKLALRRFFFETLAIISAVIAVRCAKADFEWSVPLSAFMFLTAMNINNFARGNK